MVTVVFNLVELKKYQNLRNESRFLNESVELSCNDCVFSPKLPLPIRSRAKLPRSYLVNLHQCSALNHAEMSCSDPLTPCVARATREANKELRFWNRFKQFALVETNPLESLQASSVARLNLISPRGSRTFPNQNSEQSFEKSTRTIALKLNPLHVPQQPVHVRETDSGYSSLEISPIGTNSSTDPTTSDFSGLPLNSGQRPALSAKPTLPLQNPRTFIKPRHVEIVIPSSIRSLNSNDPAAYTQHNALPDIHPPGLKASTSVPCFSRPLNPIMPDRPSSKRMSEGQSKQKKRDSGSAQSTRLSIQSAPNSAHSDRPSSQRPTSHVSFHPSPNLASDHSTNSPHSSNSPRPTTSSSTDGPVAGLSSTVGASTQHLSGLICNVHRTTGSEPPALVGASTTIVDDKLYVFGGRRLSSHMPQLSAITYELDLVRRHWTILETEGSPPTPRYFHSMCALGDSKLVCYGGMAQLRESGPKSNASEDEPAMTVMSDIHILDIASRTWTMVPTADAPPGRYAHCATILPSSGIFTSIKAPHSALHHNPSSTRPHQGRIGVDIDGRGGAMMVIAGGQDSASRYLEQISVFNLRSLKWMAPTPFSRQFGAYRSVVTRISGLRATDIGSQQQPNEKSVQNSVSSRLAEDNKDEDDLTSAGAPMLLYSNYNFLDVKLELQIRLQNGKLVEMPMHGLETPPGLRFPNGGVIAGHFIVSGTFLTSSKQEYCLWALNLRTLAWTRIEVGANVFTSGSWNRGMLWNKRNAYVVLGNRKRDLGKDYNERRLNFTHLCIVELEVFGLYENPCHSNNRSPRLPELSTDRHAHSLGLSLLTYRDLADMDILSLTGERIPINSRLVALRWGQFFAQLLAEAEKEAALPKNNARWRDSGSETATLRAHPSRSSSLNTVPGVRSSISSSSTLVSQPTSSFTMSLAPSKATFRDACPPTRLLYFPHASVTIRALLHYLYTYTLPPPHHPLSSVQTLCSLLQLARPYRVPGLVEATIQRLHQILDARSAAAIFNATAMAAGHGNAVRAIPGALKVGTEKRDRDDGTAKAWTVRSVAGRPSTLPTVPSAETSFASSVNTSGTSTDNDTVNVAPSAEPRGPKAANTLTNLSGKKPSINDEEDTDGDLSSASFDTTGTSTTSATTTDASGSEDTDGGGTAAERYRRRTATAARRRRDAAMDDKVWTGDISVVVGLQKRSLRGLVEGRRGKEKERDSQDIGSFAGQGVSAEGVTMLGSPGLSVKGRATVHGTSGKAGIGLGLGLS